MNDTTASRDRIAASIATAHEFVTDDLSRPEEQPERKQRLLTLFGSDTLKLLQTLATRNAVRTIQHATLYDTQGIASTLAWDAVDRDILACVAIGTDNLLERLQRRPL